MRNSKYKELITLISQGLPFTLKPYAHLSRQTNLSEKEIIKIISKWLKNGTIRRFAAIVNHTSVGFKANAMVVWKVNPTKIKQEGFALAKLTEITHCYQRKTYPYWKYNLYTMLHAKNKKECNRIINKISKIINVNDYKIFYSLKELKKTSLNLSLIWG